MHHSLQIQQGRLKLHRPKKGAPPCVFVGGGQSEKHTEVSGLYCYTVIQLCNCIFDILYMYIYALYQVNWGDDIHLNE